jgi:hypothetical protein
MEEEVQPKQKLIRRSVPLPAQPEQKKERIKVWVAFMLATLVLSIDGFQALLGTFAIGIAVNSVITAVAYFAFWVIFMLMGVSFIENPKSLAAIGISGLAELIPALNMLPALSAGVISVILITMAEDKGGIIGEAAGLMQGKFKQG